jgi:tRNA (cytidine56-2'-O)-methyltransferase
MITILRIGHRPGRDKRITTHVGLVARAFNADRLLVDTKDIKLEDTLNSVITRFGDGFEVKSGISWRKTLKNWTGNIVHLTMYGEHIDKIFKNIPINSDQLIVVGSEKVPREVYERAHFNIAIGHQPHSEVAALAIFLDRFFGGSELNKDFNGKLNIQDCTQGKIVLEK